MKSSAKCRPRKLKNPNLDGAGCRSWNCGSRRLVFVKRTSAKDIEGGGVNINNVRESNFQRAVTSNDLLFGKHILLRKGKKNYVVVTAK